MKVTKATWNPLKGEIHTARSGSVDALKKMDVGDCLRIEHNDITCTMGTGKYPASCSLNRAISRLRDQGFEYESYHEGQYIMVVRRVC